MKQSVVIKISFLATIIFLSFAGFAYYQFGWTIEQISYCELGSHPERYDGKLIRVKAPITGGLVQKIVPEQKENERYYHLYNLDCDFGIEANSTALRFDAAYVPDPKTKHWLETLLKGETFAEKKGHQAILTGWFNGRYSNGCWGPKYAMRVIKIEPIS